MGQIAELDKCLGSNLLRIQTAIEVIEIPPLKLAHYKIIVVSEKDIDFVLFIDKSERVNTRENLGVQYVLKDKKKSGHKIPPDQIRTLLTKMDQLKTLDILEGSNLLAIRAAIPVFLKSKKVKLTEYKIDVVRDGDSTIVIFVDKDRKRGVRGHNVNRPGFEVELNPKDLKVLRSNFLR